MFKLQNIEICEIGRKKHVAIYNCKTQKPAQSQKTDKLSKQLGNGNFGIGRYGR